MIGRYSVDEISEIWSRNSRVKNYIKIERLLNDALIKHKVIPENKLSARLQDFEDDIVLLAALDDIIPPISDAPAPITAAVITKAILFPQAVAC